MSRRTSVGTWPAQRMESQGTAIDTDGDERPLVPPTDVVEGLERDLQNAPAIAEHAVPGKFTTGGMESPPVDVLVPYARGPLGPPEQVQAQLDQSRVIPKWKTMDSSLIESDTESWGG